MSIFLLTFVIFLPKTLFGFFVVDYFWPEKAWQAGIVKLISGFGLGLGVSSALMLLAMRLGVAPGVYAKFEFGSNLTLLLGLAIRFFWVKRAFFQHQTGFLAEKSGLRKEWLIFSLFGLSFLLSLGTFVYYAFQQPHGLSDAWTLWNNLARYIFRSNDPGLIFDTSRYFRAHFDYPAMYSLNIAWAWALAGTDSTRVPMAFAVLSTFALPVVLWASVSHLKGNFQGALVAIVALMTPSLGLTIGQYSDALLGLLFLLTGVFLY